MNATPRHLRQRGLAVAVFAAVAVLVLAFSGRVPQLVVRRRKALLQHDSAYQEKKKDRHRRVRSRCDIHDICYDKRRLPLFLSM